MNFFTISKFIGTLLLIFGASMLPSLLWGFTDGSWKPLAGAMIVTAAVGGGLYFVGRLRPQEIYRKEATAIVGLGWLLAAAVGALPFYFARLEEMPTYTHCFFESMSGLTTTGASVLTDIEALPRSILFWRSWTHWLGGLGIIMLFVAILPYLGAGGRALVKSEITGPVKGGLTPRIKDTALLLWRLYVIYTVVETLLLMAAGMSFFDALCHTFGTVATGGFSTKNDSIASMNLSVVLILTLFMFLAGTNFALMHTFFRFKERSWALWRDPEWRAYGLTLAGSILLVTVVLMRSPIYDSGGPAIRDSLFTVVSITTTTGFVNADFEAWPVSSQCLLFLLMFVGGCAGSTGGGMKVMRCIILVKMGRSAIDKVYRPRTVRQIKMGGEVLGEDLQRTTLGFFLLWMLVMGLGSLLIAVIEGGNPGLDLISPFSAVASTLNNIGPGFSMIAATKNYAGFSPLSMWLLSLFMVLGRLELYSILLLFLPRFWRAE